MHGPIKYRRHQRQLENDEFPRHFEETAQVGNVRFGNIVVSQQRRKREEEQRYRDKWFADSGDHALDSQLRIGRCIRVDGYGQVCNDHAAIRAMDIVGAGYQDHECRRRANEKRVDVYRKSLHETLLGRMPHLACRCRMWPRTLTGFV